MAIARIYLRNLGIALSQFGNAILAGDPDETISSRAGKYADDLEWSWLVWILNKIDPGHTDRAREDDEGDKGAL